MLAKAFSELDKTSGYVISVGKFDALHLGHQKLIHTLKKHRPKRRILLIVIEPEESSCRVWAANERLGRLKDLGVDREIRLPLEEIRTISYQSFLEDLLLHCSFQAIAMSPKLCIGHERLGSFENIRQYLAKKAPSVHVLPIDNQHSEGQVISSTLIRKKLIRGEVEAMPSLLGHSYYLEGTIKAGQKKGRTIDYPTANLSLPEKKCLPKEGTYISRSTLDGKHYASMTYLGPSRAKPEEKILETHLLNFNQTVYNAPLKVEFLKYLRRNEKFNHLTQLKKQLELDKQATLQFYTHNL